MFWSWVSRTFHQPLIPGTEKRNNLSTENDFTSIKTKGIDNDLGAYKAPDPESFKNPKIRNGSTSVDKLMKIVNRKMSDANHKFAKEDYIGAKGDYSEAERICLQIKKKEKDHFLAGMMLKQIKSKMTTISEKTDIGTVLEEKKN